MNDIIVKMITMKILGGVVVNVIEGDRLILRGWKN